MPFEFSPLSISGLVLIQPGVFKDSRGYFLESYKYSEFKAHGIEEKFVQDNISKSSTGVIRGLHYQNPPHAQGKLVSVLDGEIMDVAVDIRTQSTHKCRWIAEKLSSQNRKMLYSPPGFAHGFCVLSDYAVVMYKCTNEYSPDHDRGIVWNDPDISIDWPVKNPVISEKDKALPRFKDIESAF